MVESFRGNTGRPGCSPGGLRYPAHGNFEDRVTLVKLRREASKSGAAYLTMSYTKDAERVIIKDGRSIEYPRTLNCGPQHVSNQSSRLKSALFESDNGV